MHHKYYILILALILLVGTTSAGSWSQVAAQLNGETNAYSLTTYDDGSGNAIFGGTGTTGRLFKYNSSLGGWSQVAAQNNSQQYILSLTTYDDGTGNAIFGGTTPNGRLFKYNKTLNNWSQVATTLNAQTDIYSLSTYDDGIGTAIFGGTGPNGRLFKYNSSLHGWSQVATSLNSQTIIHSLIKYNDGSGDAIFGGTYPNGLLFKYNKTLNNWSQVAAQLNGQTWIRALTVYNDGSGDAVYGGTNTGGRLFKYNRTTGGWLQVATQLGAETFIHSLTTYNDSTGDAVFGGTAVTGFLYKYNRSLGGWNQVAAQLNSQTIIRSLITYDDGTGNTIFGGTYPLGRLFKFFPKQPVVADFYGVPLIGDHPLSVSFVDTSTGAGLYNWSWNFGDGNTSFQRNPTYIYDVIGLKTVSLTVKGVDGQNIKTRTDYVNVTTTVIPGAPPIADFVNGTTPRSGLAPLNVIFNDTSDAYNAINWTWDFTNDGIIDATTQNASHDYTIGGLYTVRHGVTNSSGSSDETKIDYITVNALPVAIFSCFPTSGALKFDTACTDASTGTPTSYYWSIENTTGPVIPMTSTVKNPIFNMTYPDIYNVNLSVTNGFGNDWENKTGYIMVSTASRHDSNNWSQVAAQLNSQTYIRSLLTYNDGTGNTIFGGTYPSGLLFKYNNSLLGGWLQVASQLNGETNAYAITTYDDGTGNAIYGGTGLSGLLYKYNTTLGGWSRVASQLNSQVFITSLIAYNDGTGNAIFGGTGANGLLFKYNKTLNNWSQVAAQLNGQTYIYALTTYDDGTGNAIFGGTTSGGWLYKYNLSLHGWKQVATNSELTIFSLIKYDDGSGEAIFGGTYPNGLLYKYNKTLGNWSQVASQLNSQTWIRSLTTYDDGTGTAIYGGTYPDGLLFKYNYSTNGWKQVAYKLNGQINIHSLITYNDGTGNSIFGGTGETGLLFVYPARPPVVSFTCFPLSGNPPLVVACTDVNTVNVDSRNWSFGDFNYSSSHDPTNVYGPVGSYNVSLTICSVDHECSSLTKYGYITVVAPTPPTPPFVINGTNVSYYFVYANTSYVGTEGRIPLELWLTIVISGGVFLIISLFFRRAEIISSLIATLLFGVASYVSLVLILVTQDSHLASFITNQTVVGNTTAVTIVSILQPVSYEIGSVWLSILCLGLFIIAALKVFLGVSNMLAQAGEEADETIDRGEIESVNIPDMRDVANGRYGTKNNKFK